MPINTQKSKSKKRPLNDYARYSAIGFQMAAVIFLFTWGGVKLDEYLHLKIPIFTLLLSLASVVLSLWYFLKDIGNSKN
ncbi:MAG: AtpZ/AtpI family protein [Bacteroidetes bacterium]|nr:AtpZ/AtpI family protein [Bacteroidota bacterium]